MSLTGFLLAAVAQLSQEAACEPWQPLARDGLHDPEAAGVPMLQSPAEALSVLPRDTAGNKVDWVRALDTDAIDPRESLDDDTALEVLDTEIVMRDTSTLNWVLFPHRPHTQWLACENCHESPFVARAGANPINMGKILDGEYCGVCHGAVAFPLTECNRCHSVRPDSVSARDVETTDPGETR